MGFDVLLTSVGVVAGAIAAVTGFGIGSLLTPLLALHMEARLAVAAVSIPHLAGTAFRLWMLGGRVDSRVLWTFGLTSAAGGLTGALLQAQTGAPWLTLIFGALLLFAALSEVTGLSARMCFRGPIAWVAGALSGLLGGLVGNQGGIRSAALLGFGMTKETFVSTATAIGLLVDAARMPIYLWTAGPELSRYGWWMALATTGVLTGTLIGGRVLRRMPDLWFRRAVAAILALLGLSMIGRAL